MELVLVVFYLRRYNRDYQDYSRQMKELCEKYPAIIQLIDGNNGVTLNDEEYQVFKTYSELSSNREMLERAYYYYFGQADMFHYQKLLKEISETKEREPEQRKKEILECMRQFRLEEAEKEFRFDPKYQKERDEVFQYEQELRSMGLSEEIITVIDNYLCALNAEWLRYGELAYQYGIIWIIVMEHSRYMLMLYGQIGILIVLLKMKLSLNRMAMELVNICLIKYRKLN